MCRSRESIGVGNKQLQELFLRCIRIEPRLHILEMKHAGHAVVNRTVRLFGRVVRITNPRSVYRPTKENTPLSLRAGAYGCLLPSAEPLPLTKAIWRHQA